MQFKVFTLPPFHFQKATLIPGGSESLVYTTLSGTVGVLVPFTSHEDQDFFQHLEMHMRSENSPLCGRDHLSFRSYYFPVKVSHVFIHLGQSFEAPSCNFCQLSVMYFFLRMLLMGTSVNSSTPLILLSRKA